MTRAAPLPPDLGPSFTVRRAHDLGVSEDRLRSSDLGRPFVGARTLRPAFTVRDRALAIAPLLEPSQRFSHLTAAELQGMRLPEGRARSELHITYSNASRAMRRPGITGHRSRFPAAARTLDGAIRVSAPIDTWCECGEVLAVDDLVVMGDGLLSRRDPMATIGQLRRAVSRRAGRRGTARLRTALDQIRPNTDSARETLLRLMLIRAGLPDPDINAQLRDRDDRLVAHGDLVWPQFGVVVEYDGRHHAESRKQFAIDIRRLNDIAELGLLVIRVDRDLMDERHTLLRRVERALRSRGWSGR